MAKKYDVFISYNSEDREPVQVLVRLLQGHGVGVWPDVWALRPGMPWQASLEESLSSCRTAIVAVGRSGIGPWQNEEIHALLSRFVRANQPVVPVLLPDAFHRIEADFLSGEDLGR